MFRMDIPVEEEVQPKNVWEVKEEAQEQAEKVGQRMRERRKTNRRTNLS
jgi:hypothetical protein